MLSKTDVTQHSCTTQQGNGVLWGDGHGSGVFLQTIFTRFGRTCEGRGVYGSRPLLVSNCIVSVFFRSSGHKASSQYCLFFFSLLWFNEHYLYLGTVLSGPRVRQGAHKNKRQHKGGSLGDDVPWGEFGPGIHKGWPTGGKGDSDSDSRKIRYLAYVAVCLGTQPALEVKKNEPDNKPWTDPYVVPFPSDTWSIFCNHISRVSGT